MNLQLTLISSFEKNLLQLRWDSTNSPELTINFTFVAHDWATNFQYWNPCTAFCGQASEFPKVLLDCFC
jgi:hypothetical protein